jgi:Zn-dependent metalloprotease
VKRIVAGGFTAALVSAVAVVSAPIGAHAATVHHPDRQATPSARTLAATSARNLVSNPPASLRASRFDRFSARPVASSHGLQYVPYERSWKGLPVVGGDFVVVTDAHGHILTTSVAQRRATHVGSTHATVTRASARAVAARQVAHPSLGASRLVVLQRDTSRLAWETAVSGTRHGDPSVLSVYTDARNGRLLTSREHVADGTGTGAINGPNPLTIGTSGSGSSYSMSSSSSANTPCQNAATNSTYTGTDNAWGNGSATDRETGCVDALYAVDKEVAMLSAWDGRNGFNGSGSGWPIRIGLDDENAYYDGTQVQIGHNTAGQWIPSMDVLGHELGHGVDDHTPGGISGKGTQEFVADTFGAATEWFANEPAPYDTPDFTVGEEVNLVGSGPIRYMYQPSLAGDSNCYSSSTPTSEVHAAAGPGNHWFYLLAMGTNPTNGQPTSPTCNGSSVTGLGIQKAEKIMYNAMLMKTSTSSYLKYRTWTLTAAKNLYPGSCTEFNTVKAAWNAVSVPAQTGDPTCTTAGNTVTVNNPGNQTGTVGTPRTLQVTASDSASGQTLTYSASGLPAGMSINASTGLVSGTPTTAATYSTTVTARDTTGATGSASFTWTVSGTGGGGCSGQRLGNPGFETGSAAPWSASSGVVDSSTGQPAHSGSWKAWLDGYGSSHTDSLSQSVSIPAGCGATLSFYLHIDSAETTGSSAYDRLTVKAGSTTLATYSNLNKASGYSLKSFNVSSFAGQTVSISFTGTEDSSLATSFVVDDTALNLS